MMQAFQWTDDLRSALEIFANNVSKEAADTFTKDPGPVGDFTIGTSYALQK